MTKLLMPYITAGVGPDWATYLTAFEEAGADLIEVGLPFSDPTVDGLTIQEASDAALARGATPASVLAKLATIRVGIPLIASTYANIALRPGFADALRAAGVTGLIVPDLPLDELAGLSAPGIEVSLLASPATPDDRLAEIGRRSQGFVYAVSVMPPNLSRVTAGGGPTHQSVIAGSSSVGGPPRSSSIGGRCLSTVFWYDRTAASRPTS